MTNPLAPSRNPTNNDSMVGMFHVVLEKFLQSIDDMLPAQIVAFDRATGMAQVQPLISIITTDNTILQRAPVMSVPVMQIGGGGFMLNFPIAPGDLGWLKSNDRDISLFKQFWAQSPPNTSRKHDFGDAIFIPSILTGFAIAGADASNVTLQSLNGSVRLSMGAGVAISDETGYSQSASAILDCQSTTKAFKLPAMTTSQKAAIPSPKAGFMVWDTTEGGVSTYNGSVWS